MIQNVSWDLVYNVAIEANGGAYPEPPAAAAAEETAAEGDADRVRKAAAAAAVPTVELFRPGHRLEHQRDHHRPAAGPSIWSTTAPAARTTS